MAGSNVTVSVLFLSEAIQLTRDRQGKRTSTYQDVTSGGIKTGSSFVQNIQTSLNIDTAPSTIRCDGK
jgi:hypothetical protein